MSPQGELTTVLGRSDVTLLPGTLLADRSVVRDGNSAVIGGNTAVIDRNAVLVYSSPGLRR